MELYTIISIICGAITATGAIATLYHTYKLITIDASARGLPHPKLLSFLIASGQNGGGILLYLVARRKYPIHLTDEARGEMERLKRKIGIALVFLALGAIGMVWGFAFS
jgi:hypothetical protein